MKKIAVIAGAGPAGLTAALELLRRTDITPIVLEADAQVGGISKTINYRGNRMDLGGHRFFSKSDWVMRWWQDILPIADDRADRGEALRISYQNQSKDFRPEPKLLYFCPTRSMLIRERLSRIFYRRHDFLTIRSSSTLSTLKNLGPAECRSQIGLSYGHVADLCSASPELIAGRFFRQTGLATASTERFSRDYTEKVWGVRMSLRYRPNGARNVLKAYQSPRRIKHALFASPLRRI